MPTVRPAGHRRVPVLREPAHGRVCSGRTGTGAESGLFLLTRGTRGTSQPGAEATEGSAGPRRVPGGGPWESLGPRKAWQSRRAAEQRTACLFTQHAADATAETAPCDPTAQS